MHIAQIDPDNESQTESDNFLEDLVNNPEKVISIGSRVFSLRDYSEISACACVPPFESDGIRQRILKSFQSSLKEFNPNKTVHLSVAGAGKLYEAAQFVAHCVLNDYRKIQLDLFDLFFTDEKKSICRVASFQHFYSLLAKNNIQMQLSLQSNRNAVDFLNLEQIAPKKLTNPSAHVELRVFGDAARSEALNYYRNENQRRIIIACDFVEAGYNPFPILKKMRQFVASGSYVIVANKHNINITQYINRDSCCFFFRLKKDSSHWKEEQFTVFNTLTCQENTSKDRKEYGYLQQAAITSKGPMPELLNRNKGFGPYNDWGRFSYGNP